MSLEILNTPSKVFLTGNPANVKVRHLCNEEDWYTSFASAHTVFTCPLTFNGDYVMLPAFNISWNGHSEDFYFGLSYPIPSANDGNHIRIRNDEYQGNWIFEAFKKNSNLMRDFVITSQGVGYHDGNTYHTFNFKARLAGPKYNLTITRGCLSVLTAVTTDSADNYNPVGRLALHIIRGTLPQIEFDKYFITDEALTYGISETDIAKYCQAKTTGHFTFPEASAKYVTQDILQKIDLVLGIKRGVPEVETIYTLPNSFYALDGGFSDLKLTLLNNVGQNFVQHLGSGTSRKFLTFAPNPKPTDIYAPEKLYYLTPSAGDYRIYVKKYFKCIDKTTYSDVIALGENVIIEILASYKVITADELFKVYSYEIWMQDNAGNRVSEKFAFTVDRNYYSFARYFLFKNSYGVYDCVRTTGKVTKSQPIKKTFVNVGNSSALTSLGIRKLQTSVKNDITYKLNTGNNTRQMNEWLTEFFNSQHVVFLRGTLALPVVITSSDDDSELDGNVPESRTCTIEQLYFEDFSHELTSDQPQLPDFNDDYNKDFNTYSFKDSGDFVPIAYAGPDITVNSFTDTLNASEIDEDLTGTWTVISGPGTVIFADNHDAKTNVVATRTGTYILRWTVSIGTCSEFDDTVVIFNISKPYAGVDITAKSATLTTQLQGESNLGCVWTKTSGPGTVTFDDDNLLTTGVQFSAEGTYILRLALLSDDTIYDEVQVIINYTKINILTFNTKTQDFREIFDVYNTGLPLGQNCSIQRGQWNNGLFLDIISDNIANTLGMRSKEEYPAGNYEIILKHSMYYSNHAFVVMKLANQRVIWIEKFRTKGDYTYPAYGSMSASTISVGTVTTLNSGKLDLMIPSEYIECIDNGGHLGSHLTLQTIEINKLD